MTFIASHPELVNEITDAIVEQIAGETGLAPETVRAFVINQIASAIKNALESIGSASPPPSNGNETSQSTDNSSGNTIYIPTIDVSTDEITLTATAGGTGDSQTFDLENTGQPKSVLKPYSTVTADSPADAPTSAVQVSGLTQVPEGQWIPVTVSASGAGLEADQSPYKYTLEISDPNSSNGVEDVEVIINVTAPSAVISASLNPSPITATAGAPSATASLTIATTAPGSTLEYQVTGGSLSGLASIEFSPSTGSVAYGDSPATCTVTVNAPSGGFQTGGNYSGTITILSTYDGKVTPLQIMFTVTVNPAASTPVGIWSGTTDDGSYVSVAIYASGKTNINIGEVDLGGVTGTGTWTAGGQLSGSASGQVDFWDDGDPTLDNATNFNLFYNSATDTITELAVDFSGGNEIYAGTPLTRVSTVP
jgi:hypothetical protein